MSNEEIDKQFAICDAATPGPWRSMRRGNQFIEAKYLPTARVVAASEIPELVRPWNPHACISFMKLDAAETARFIDADADFIAAARTGYPEALRDLKLARAEIRRSWRDGYDELRRE